MDTVAAPDGFPALAWRVLALVADVVANSRTAVAVNTETTRVRITAGEAVVAGANVATEPAAVRRRIGVVPQRPNPDRSLSVIENLVFHATYFGIARAEAARRGAELLERLGIADKMNAKVDF